MTTQTQAATEALEDLLEDLGLAYVGHSLLYLPGAVEKVLRAAAEHDDINGMIRIREHEVNELIHDRDRAQEWADTLAAAIAPYYMLGEHSSMNHPWSNALEYAAGTHRLVIDDATVERVSEILLQNFDWCECRRSPFDKHDVNPPCSTRVRARDSARAMLLAAVEDQ